MGNRPNDMVDGFIDLRTVRGAAETKANGLGGSFMR
jgi:hypothetical protein